MTTVTALKTIFEKEPDRWWSKKELQIELELKGWPSSSIYVNLSKLYSEGLIDRDPDDRSTQKARYRLKRARDDKDDRVGGGEATQAAKGNYS